MLHRINIRDAAVRALEMEAVRRDRAIEQVNWRTRRTSSGSARQRGEDPCDFNLEFRWLAVADKSRAVLAHPRLDLQLGRRPCRGPHEPRSPTTRPGEQ